MSRLFYHVMQDTLGNLLFGVTGTMRLAGTGTLATVYGDEALTVPIPNPMANHPSFGSFKCYLGAGSYDFHMAKSGYTFETLTGLQGGGGMANQEANAVAITGGSITGTSISELGVAAGVQTFMNEVGINTLPVTGFSLVAQYQSRFNSELSCLGHFGVRAAAHPTVTVDILYESTGGYTGMRLIPGSAGAATPIAFLKSDQSAYTGTITTTDTTTSYNTTSDARLKHAIIPLTGALDVVRRLNPITHLWRSDDSPGVGFCAHEVQTVAPEAVTGAPDAVDEAGQIVPQGMDYGKLVPYLVSAVKELTQQVEMLTAKLAAASA